MMGCLVAKWLALDCAPRGPSFWPH